MARKRKPPPEAPTVALVVDTGAQGAQLAIDVSKAHAGIEEPADKRVLDMVLPEPWLVGHLGRAWRCDLDAAKRNDGRPDSTATIGMWVIEAKYAHPIWHSYILAICHLRPIEGVPPAVLAMHGATHEFWLAALDPEKGSREKLINGTLPGRDGAVQILHHMNFSAQLVALTDPQAVGVMEATVRDVCNGALNPDTDHRRAWIRRFGSSGMRKTI